MFCLQRSSFRLCFPTPFVREKIQVFLALRQVTRPLPSGTALLVPGVAGTRKAAAGALCCYHALAPQKEGCWTWPVAAPL